MTPPIIRQFYTLTAIVQRKKVPPSPDGSHRTAIASRPNGNCKSTEWQLQVDRMAIAVRSLCSELGKISIGHMETIKRLKQ